MQVLACARGIYLFLSSFFLSFSLSLKTGQEGRNCKKVENPTVFNRTPQLKKKASVGAG